jgi:hypothetical protein
VVALYNVSRALKFADHFKQSWRFIIANILGKLLFLVSSIYFKTSGADEWGYMAVFLCFWIALMI